MMQIYALATRYSLFAVRCSLLATRFVPSYHHMHPQHQKRCSNEGEFEWEDVGDAGT